MKMKKQDGFTGIDITVAIVIIMIFAGIIATLFYNYDLASKEIERKSQATEYAINIIEKIKNDSFENYASYNKANTFTGTEKEQTILKEQITSEGYWGKIEILDYSDIRTDINTIPGIIKKVTVYVYYKVGNQEKTVDISTVISKE